MAKRVTPLELLRSLDLLPDGPVLFGQTVPSQRPGVYLIEWPVAEAHAPFDHHALRAWLERVETLRLDGQRPTPHELAARLGRYWLPEQTVVFIGQSTRSLRRRLAEYAATPLGDRRPHAGGYWLKTLRDYEKARIWWADTDASEEYEDALLEAFGTAIDAPGTLPFANLTSVATGRREHGVTGAVLTEPEPGSDQAGPAQARWTGLQPKASRTAPGAARTKPRATSAPLREAPARRRTGAGGPRAAGGTPATAAAEPAYMTPEGLELARAELHELREVRRPEVIGRVKAARELGDLRENSEYHAAREEQSFLEGRIQQLQTLLDRAVVVEVAPADDDAVRIGSTVDVEIDGEPATYTLVGPHEAKIAEGRLSYRSPIGGALLGRHAGEEITVATPAGAHTYRLLAVR
ncbi:MAG: transcription elongation factor GreA [Candidatus Limnocylindrales bacterium]